MKAILGRSLAVLLVILLSISSIGMFNVKAQTLHKPSAPEFTAKVISETTLEVTLKNQPLTPYENGSYPNLYYWFRLKDPTTMPGFWEYDPPYYVLPSVYRGYYEASDSNFTKVSLSIEEQRFPTGQIELRAMALVGNQYPTKEQNGTVYGFEGVHSGWSNTQTIPMNESQIFTPTPTASIDPEPFRFSSPNLIIAGTIALLIALGILAYFKKRRYK